ncbi:hypothetical protein Tco_0149296 [Tanacetum coccineum]
MPFGGLSLESFMVRMVVFVPRLTPPYLVEFRVTSLRLRLALCLLSPLTKIRSSSRFQMVLMCLSGRTFGVRIGFGLWMFSLDFSPSTPLRTVVLVINGNWLTAYGWILHGVFQCYLWAVWNWRNKLVNTKLEDVTSIREEDIFPSIQRLSKTWIAARFSKGTAAWDKWISSPYDILALG